MRPELEVWQARLPEGSRETPSLQELLSPAERARSERFRSSHDRERFVVAHGYLRQVLGRYTGQRPEDLRFVCDPLGKPRLDAGGDAARIEFNLSHSGNAMVYAIACGRRVGIDVERIDPVAEDDERMSGLWLTEPELAEMARARDGDRTRAFYRAWTRKEAYLKGRGEGLSFPPHRVSATIDSDFAGAADPWTVRELEVGPGYAAAVAVEGPADPSIACRAWP